MSSQLLSRRMLALTAAAAMVLGACGNGATPPAPNVTSPSPIVITDANGFAFGIAGAMHVPGFDQPVSTNTGVLALVSTPQFLGTATIKPIKGDASKVDPRWTAILATAKSQLSKVWTTGFSAADPIAIYAGTQSAAVESRRHSDGSLNQSDLPPTTGLSSAQLLTLQLADSVPPAILATGQNEFVTAPGHLYSDGDNFNLIAAIGAARAAKDTNLEASLTVLARNNINQYNIRWANRWALLSKNANAANGFTKIIAAEQAAVTLADPTAPIVADSGDSAAVAPAPAASNTPVASGNLSVGTLGPQVDPRWAPILARAAAALAAGAQCSPASVTNPIPLYAGPQSAAVEARRRADGSLNPDDLPSTLGLTGAQATLLRIADSVPNAVLLTGQNEGVAAAGKTQNPNDAYDLLGWAIKLRAMAAGTLPPLVQDNGYVWTADDIARNLALANSNIAANQNLYNLRWQTRWSLLAANGYGDIAKAEQACVGMIAAQAPAPQATVVVPSNQASGGPGAAGATTGDQLMTVPYVSVAASGTTGSSGATVLQVPITPTNIATVAQVTSAVNAADPSKTAVTSAQLATLLAGHSDLIAQAASLGYFGAPGTVPGVDYSGFSASIVNQTAGGPAVTTYQNGVQTSATTTGSGSPVPVAGIDPSVNAASVTAAGSSANDPAGALETWLKVANTGALSTAPNASSTLTTWTDSSGVTRPYCNATCQATPGGMAAVAAAAQTWINKNPSQPYMIAGPDPSGDATGNLISYSKDQAKAWWAAYLAHPVDCSHCLPGTTPPTDVLTPDQRAQAIVIGQQQSAGTLSLPSNPTLYNPLNLPVYPHDNNTVYNSLGWVSVNGLPTAPSTAAYTAATAAYDAAMATNRYSASGAVNPNANAEATAAWDAAMQKTMGGTLITATPAAATAPTITAGLAAATAAATQSGVTPAQLAAAQSSLAQQSTQP